MLSTTAVQVGVERVDVESRRLAGLHGFELGLAEVGGHPERARIRDRDDLLARGDVIADGDGLFRDDAR